MANKSRALAPEGRSVPNFGLDQSLLTVRVWESRKDSLISTIVTGLNRGKFLGPAAVAAAKLGNRPPGGRQ